MYHDSDKPAVLSCKGHQYQMTYFVSDEFYTARNTGLLSTREHKIVLLRTQTPPVALYALLFDKNR